MDDLISRQKEDTAMIDFSNQVIGITLLSLEEATSVPRWILANGTWWWLRSPGNYSDYTVIVFIDGSVYDRGDLVDDEDVAVRPALQIANPPSLEIGEKVKVFGHIAEYIGGDMVLLREPLWYGRFDGSSNDYDQSEVKAKLDEWLEEMKNG